MLHLGLIATLTSLVHQLHPIGWMTVQVLLCAIVIWFTGRLRSSKLPDLSIAWNSLRDRAIAFGAELSPWGIATLIVIVCILVLSAITQAATPIYFGDEKMYHASRVIYWIQNRSVLPYVTHNIRQTITPFGSELFFLWPVLLTKTEAIGRTIFWLAYPLAATGQYLLLRRMNMSRTTSLAGVLILISTPLISSSAIRLKPELWSIVALLGTAYWTVSVCSASESTKTKYFFLGVFAVLSINIRAFPVAILPSVLLVVYLAKSPISPFTRVRVFAAGLVCAGIASCLLLLLASNFATYRHPLGPKEVRQHVEADFKPRVLYTHAVRFAFLLLELPDVAMPAETRQDLSVAANQLISAVGAGLPLAGENGSPWPGKFSYSLPERSTRFSLWGLLWIPTLCIAVLLLIRNIATTWPRVRLTAASAQTLLAIPLLGAVLFGARWITNAEVPARFLIGPFSLMLPVGIAIFAPHVSTRKYAQALLAIAVSYSVYSPIGSQFYNAAQAIAAPVSAKAVNQPFDEALDLMPIGSRIIFAGDQDAPDYPLFSPGARYSNVVIPWGKLPFDPARMRRLIESEQATHVLIQNDESAPVNWLPPLKVGEMVDWLAREPGLKAVSLTTPHMRLFVTANSRRINEAVFHTVEVPASSPLITIGAALRGQVGIDPGFLKTPWPVEDLGGTERGFLWIGQGRREGVEVGLWTRQERTVSVRFDGSPGPSLTTNDRTVVLLHDGVPVDGPYTFKGRAGIVFRVNLHAGRNLMSFFTLNAATVKSMPNGDTRHLVAGIHDVAVEAERAPEESGVRKTFPEKTAPGAGDAGKEFLDQSARAAAAAISRRQHSDGYWLTSYTSDEKYERPTLEMNTFLNAMMIDILDSPAIPAERRGNLDGAKAFLRNQIEAGGLVRYHGRADAPAIQTLGLCGITPDTDDTALVWRVAPGDPALLPAALATLKQYRTSDGLYRTWLGQRNEYRCIDPGSDPNPPDVGIQMHLLMLLAQADPTAAHSLCGALRQAINEDRIWVYYRRAPLVPVLRQADLQAAGCALQLPRSRAQTAVRGQDIWQTAAQLLLRLESRQGQAPTSTEVLKLLQDLASDDFRLLRSSPPLVYHNDLTASVRRFYWSEDVGYAIWLRLYSDSVNHGLLGFDRRGVQAASSGPSSRK